MVSDRKGEKDPIEYKKTTFYPFSNTNSYRIQISIQIDKTKDLGNLERKYLQINLLGDTEKIETWDRLFDIKERYNDTTRGLLKANLKKLKRRHKIFTENKEDWTYLNTLDERINDYENDKYEDFKFLRIPLTQLAFSRIENIAVQ